MFDLAASLRRDGLPVEERLLVRILACVWPGDQDGLRDCLVAAQAHEVPRGRVEEILLQGILFCGFPRVINAFRVLDEAWPTTTSPSGGALPATDQRAAGEALFAAVYATKTEDVLDMLRGHHGELHDFVIDTAYGRILSRPGLEPRVRELAAVGILAQTNQVPQMIAHGRGARRFGATPDQLREAILTATDDASQTARLLRRI